MIETTELTWQRRQTEAFIQADFSMVTLNRSSWSDDGAGGVLKGASTPLAAQKMRLIPFGEASAQRITASGEEVTPDYMLMGLWSADMQRWDEFTLNGRRYEIVYVQQNTQYEIKGEAIYRG